jgi:uncharacterized protein YbjT (DUF2867 family)
MADPSGIVLVTGATGAQGGATARRLLAAGLRVRFLTRDPQAPAARALVAAGAQAAHGDLGDPTSLPAALAGVTAVFSVQVPDRTGKDMERRHGFALVQAARAAGVTRLVHTSVARTGEHARFPGWGSGRWLESYWTDKWDVEEAVRQAGFAQWTVLQPAFMMDNLARPKSAFMFPHLARGQLLTALHPDTRLDFVAADDVGTFAAAALAGSSPLHGKTVPLASESLTMAEVAAALSGTLGSPLKAVHVSPREAMDAGLHRGWVNSQEWMNEVGYAVDIAQVHRCGLPLTRLHEWLAAYREAIERPTPSPAAAAG